MGSSIAANAAAQQPDAATPAAAMRAGASHGYASGAIDRTMGHM
jgi:hypothetical protein